MICLIGLIDPEHENDTITRAEYEALADNFNEAWNELSEFKLTVAYALDRDTGEIYRDVKFLVEARYRREASPDRYFVGGGFEFNLDKFLRKIEGRVR